MNAQPDHSEPDDRPIGASDAASSSDSADPIPEWAPLEPLPSSEMFLATFSGMQPVTAGDILHPAYDLVECQRDHRLAVEVLADADASYTELKAAAATLVTAQSDIAVLIAIIDDAVSDRMKQRRDASDDSDEVSSPISLVPTPHDRLPVIPTHTESIGEIAAHMAELWGATIAKVTQPTMRPEFPETVQLIELCVAYDCLAAEIESGRRMVPGM